MEQSPTPLLITKDWNEEWMEQQKARQRFDDAQAWTLRARSYKTYGNSAYTQQFLEALDLQEEDTLLDMGCGTGALAIPLAERGYKVIAADFSEGMLGSMKEAAHERNLEHLITPKLMSWQDDWSAFGLTDNCVDIALASRSIATSNLKESLMKLHKAARKKAYITLATGGSPRSDPRVIKAIGLEHKLGRDFLYAFNILAQSGLMPTVSYLDGTKSDAFTSFQDAFESLSRMVNDLTYGMPVKEQEDALDRLRLWLHEDLSCVQGEDGPLYYLSEPRRVTWALISWKTS